MDKNVDLMIELSEKLNSSELIKIINKRFDDLKHKKFEFKSFQNGFLECFAVLSTDWIDLSKQKPLVDGFYLVYFEQENWWTRGLYEGGEWHVKENINDLPTHYMEIQKPAAEHI